MATLPMNVQARTLRPGAGYIAWDASGATFNVKRDLSTKTWRATATRSATILFATTLRDLATKLDATHSDPALASAALQLGLEARHAAPLQA